MPFRFQNHVLNLDEDEFIRWYTAHSSLGVHPETRDRLFIPVRDRFSGLVVTGTQGNGKSGLLQNLICEDAHRGYSIIGIDPHGDLTQDCIARLPEKRLTDAYVLDMEDEARPFGVNVFGGNDLSTSIAQAQAVDRVMHVFEVLWPEITSQQYLGRYLRASTIVLFNNPGSTLVDMHTFLVDEITRTRMLQAVTDPSVRRFWQSYDELSASARRQQVEPLIGRLESLFMGRSLVRNIVGQRETSINFRKAIERKEIIFIKLPIKTLAQDARLIGTLLIAQIHAAIFSFADMPENKRPGFSLYVDEFQHFATPDFSEMFTEGRKFGVRVTVAHQYRGQLPSYLRESTMTARTKVCFQLTPEDAREMAHLFPDSEPVVRPADIDQHPVQYLLREGADDPFVHTFIEYYLRLVLKQIKGDTVEIVQRGLPIDPAWYILIGQAPPGNLIVPNPLPELNRLLYTVMKTGDDTLFIPPDAMLGFGNIGKGFFSALDRARHKAELLSGDVRFPPYLVIEGAHGLRWTRKPETSKEQLFHFLFYLRRTMLRLAHEPIGKKSTLSTADVASMLTQLPRRAAFVRSGEDVGVIYTDETHDPVDPMELRERLRFIREQTRLKYCRPVGRDGTDIDVGIIPDEPEDTTTDELDDTMLRPIVGKPQPSPWEEMQ